MTLISLKPPTCFCKVGEISVQFHQCKDKNKNIFSVEGSDINLPSTIDSYSLETPKISYDTPLKEMLKNL